MSFRLKIVLGLLVIQVILLVILIWSSLNFLRTSNEVELSNRASSTATLLATTLKEFVAAEDREGLQRYVNEILAQPGTTYVRIVGRSGVLVEGGDPRALARPFSEDFLMEDVTDGVFDVAAGIADEQGRVLGSVQLGFSTRAITSVMSAARRETTTIVVIGLGVTLLISLMLGNYFARQLTSLRNATRRIASGDIGYQLAVTGSDELAQTANAFNTMSRKLALMYSEKQAALNGARQTASELRESERRIQSVLNHALDAIITIDENGIIETFNPAAEKIFGYTAAEAIGNNVTMLMPETYRAEHDTYIQDFIRTGNRRILGVTREIEGRRKDGTVFPMEIDVSEVQIEGRYLFIGIARDITDRKQAETALREAKDAALQSSRNKFEFIANVSREIRAPVNNMLNALNLLLETGLSPEQREYVESIQNSGDSLITILNDVLDFSKIEAGKLELESIDFDLWRTVDVVYQMFKERAARKGLNFVYIMPYTVPTSLRGDPTRLRQLLLNLIDNAIKFTDKGEVLLRIDLAEDAVDHTVLRFEVSDSGIGIAPHIQQRIFEIFEHTETPMTVRHKSSGLGLVICKRLVEMMRGEIGVSSEPGHGSTFWFTARFEKAAAEKARPEPGYEQLENLKVLVVNARDSMRATLQNMVNEVGMHSYGVEDGVHALEELCSAAEHGHPYDLVIFDMLMPGMSGLQLAHTIRADERIAAVRMIMVAATGYRGDSEEVRRVGIQGYLTAPIERQQLYDCIAAVMRIDEHDQETFITRHSLAAAREPYQGHVLVVSEDGERQKQLLARLERLGYRASLATDAEQAVEAVAWHHYEFVLVDNEPREIVGADALRRIRNREHEGLHIPLVIIVSPAASRDQQQAYRAAGADQCFTGLRGIEALRGHLH